MTAKTKKKMPEARKQVWVRLKELQAQGYSLKEARAIYKKEPFPISRVKEPDENGQTNSRLTGTDRLDLNVIQSATAIATELLKVCGMNINIASDVLNNTANILERMADERRAENG